jgi:transcriptional repressor NrdR
MHCPFCNHGDTQVMETRVSDTGDTIRRRRRWAGCDRRFTTYERIELSMPTVVKNDGGRVDYDRAKLEFSMNLALRKRPVSKEAFESALDHVEGRLFKLGLKVVPSATIGELVMDELRKLDKVAYIRFASVYRKFEDIDAFADAINEIRPGGNAPAAAGRPRTPDKLQD